MKQPLEAVENVFESVDELENEESECVVLDEEVGEADCSVENVEDEVMMVIEHDAGADVERHDTGLDELDDVVDIGQSIAEIYLSL